MLRAEITRPRVIVVGGGLTGLAAARELACRADVTLVERLPAAGGGWGFQHRQVRTLVAQCRDSGVEFVLGATALRWREHRLLVVGPGQTRWLRADQLVYAGGTRPAHAAELRVAGGRLAGVFTATVAHHLLDAGIRLGRRPVVTGWGDWVDLIVPELMKHGRVSVVGGSTSDSLPWPGVQWWPGYRPAILRGGSRVSQLDVLRDATSGTSGPSGAAGGGTGGAARATLDCDCVIFAGDLRPLRNVDGANQEGAEAVTFIQPTSPRLGAAAVIEFASDAAAAVAVAMTRKA